MNSPAKNAVRSRKWHRLLALPTAVLRWPRWAWQAIAVGAVIAAVFTGSLRVWQQVRSHVEQQREYLVTARDLEITTPPPWIRSNVRAQAILDGLPPQLSILDQRLTERLSQAFALNPWIAHIGPVQTSYPAHVRVELQYRRPVAMVEFYGGLLPVDSDGVLLPTEDFTPAEAQTYPRIVGITSSPLGPFGTPWADATVEAAVRLANFLHDAWPELALHHIRPQERMHAAGSKVVLELATGGGTTFVWGSTPGEEAIDEAKAPAKLDRVRQLATSAGSLDAVPADLRDLRH